MWWIYLLCAIILSVSVLYFNMQPKKTCSQCPNKKVEEPLF